MFPVGSVVPAMDYRMPAPVESQYHTDQFVSAYDSIADFPDRPDNCLPSPTRSPAWLPVTPRLRSPTRAMCRRRTSGRRSTQRVRRRRRTWFPNSTCPSCCRFKYLGYDEDTLNQLDAILMPTVNAGYSRNDDPATAPVQVDPVRGFDPLQVTEPANEATFGGGAGPHVAARQRCRLSRLTMLHHNGG